MKIVHVIAAMAAALCFVARASDEDRAKSEPPPPVVERTLEKAARTGTVLLGYRASSMPFSSRSLLDEPIGYSIDLCREIVAEMGKTVGRNLAIDWVPVTSPTRIDAVVNGDVDLECGSTTITKDRATRVAFSGPIYEAHTKLLVRKGTFGSIEALTGRRIAVTNGTTTKAVISARPEKFKVVPSDDHAGSFAKLVYGEADAVANDDVLLKGLIAQMGLEADYEVLSEALSDEPYGIMYRKDDAPMAEVVTDTVDALEHNGHLEGLKRRWRLESGMSAERQSVVALLGALDRSLNAASSSNPLFISAGSVLLFAAALLAIARLHRDRKSS